MRGRQMIKKRGIGKTCVEKSSIPSIAVHVANNKLVLFYCYICICCLKLHQASGLLPCLRVFIIFFYFFVGRWGWRVVCSSIWWGSTALCSNVFTIWCRILISGLPRVFWRFKRRSCYIILFISVYIWTQSTNIFILCDHIHVHGGVVNLRTHGLGMSRTWFRWFAYD